MRNVAEDLGRAVGDQNGAPFWWSKAAWTWPIKGILLDVDGRIDFWLGEVPTYPTPPFGFASGRPSRLVTVMAPWGLMEPLYTAVWRRVPDPDRWGPP
jgi:hypothetical protein